MWCRDSCRSSKLAAMVYLVTRKTTTHSLVFLPCQEWMEAAVQALTSAGVSCGKMDGLSDDSTVLHYNNGLIKVLLVTDSMFKKNQTNQVKMVVMLATADSAAQYRERLEKARGGSLRPFTCVSVLPREEGASLRPVMHALKQPFTQRTVLGDVLTAIEQQVKKQEDVSNTSNGVSSEEEEDSSDDDTEQEDEEEPAATTEPAVVIQKKPCGKKRHLNASLKSTSISSNRTKPIDGFFSGIESKISAMDAVLVVTASNKSRQKKLLRKKKKQQKRSESILSDTESDDDSDDSDVEEEDERPRKVARGAVNRPAGPGAKKRTSSTTEALTDVGVEGVKKYRNALTYQERTMYNKIHGNAKK